MSTYGLCPICGAGCKYRERRPNGNDTCINGHVYPSADSIEASPMIAADDSRDVVVQWKTTPAQLRDIAFQLESCHSVRVNWYTSQIVFVNKENV